MVSGRTTAWKWSSSTPALRASSFRVVPFLCADFAMAAGLVVADGGSERRHEHQRALHQLAEALPVRLDADDAIVGEADRARPRSADRAVGGGFLMMLTASAVMFGAFLLTSIYLQDVLGMSALETGLAFLPMAVIIGAGAHLGGHLVGHAGLRIAMAAAFTLAAAGMLLLAGVESGGSYVTDVLPGMLVAGFGLGIALVSVALSVLTGAADEEAGMLSGLNTTGHEVGGSLGVAVLVTIATGALGAATSTADLAAGLADAFLVAGLSPRPAACSRCSSCRRRLPSCRRCATLRVSRSTSGPVPASRPPADGTTPRRRADAERSIARILDAAIDALGDDQEASMAAIARRAGVVRATIYVHFPTRESCSRRSPSGRSTRPPRSSPRRNPMWGARRCAPRVVAATWRASGATTRSSRSTPRCTVTRGAAPPSRHGAPRARAAHRTRPGGRRFRADVPASWHLSMLMALVHAASGELRAGRVGEADAEAALVASMLGAVTAAPRHAAR